MIIDYGGHKCLGGYNVDESGPLTGVFSVAGKNKEEKQLDRNVEQFDILKGNYKQLMERDYVNCMSVFELVTEHIMGELVGEGPIDSAVMISECMA